MKFEENLRKTRDEKHDEILSTVKDHQADSHAHAKSVLDEISKHHGHIDEKSADLTQKMNDRQRNNVEKLINDINDDLVANKQEIINLEQQINDVDSSYTTLIA